MYLLRWGREGDKMYDATVYVVIFSSHYWPICLNPSIVGYIYSAGLLKYETGLPAFPALVDIPVKGNRIGADFCRIYIVLRSAETVCFLFVTRQYNYKWMRWRGSWYQGESRGRNIIPLVWGHVTGQYNYNCVSEWDGGAVDNRERVEEEA